VAATPLQMQWLQHHNCTPEDLLVTTNTTHDYTKVLDTDLFSCSSGEKFQNVNRSSAAWSGLLSPPSEANFTIDY